MIKKTLYLIPVVFLIGGLGIAVPQMIQNEASAGLPPCSLSTTPDDPLQVNIIAVPEKNMFVSRIAEKEVFNCGSGALFEVTTSLRFHERPNGGNLANAIEIIECQKFLIPSLNVNCSSRNIPLDNLQTVTDVIGCTPIGVFFGSDYAHMMIGLNLKDKFLLVEKNLIACDTLGGFKIVEVFILEENFNRKPLSNIETVYCLKDEANAFVEWCAKDASFIPALL